MKHPLTAQRLKKALSDLNMKPQELADRSGVSKASISQYVNGSHAPSNISSGKMGKILSVNPLWLMGFDVPREENVSDIPVSPEKSEPIIMSYYNQLNALGQETATEHVRLLTLDKKYTEKSVREYPSLVRDPDADYLTVGAAHARTDIQIPDDDDDPYDDKIMDDENF